VGRHDHVGGVPEQDVGDQRHQDVQGDHVGKVGVAPFRTVCKISLFTGVTVMTVAITMAQPDYRSSG
jgi:hypothetical protein